MLLPISKTMPKKDASHSRCVRLCKLFAGYIAIYAVFFWGIHAGVGQFWDWSFPYFSDQLEMLFSNKASSWTSANGGSPLGYASDYFLRFFVAMFGFLPPEIVRYGLLVLVFATGSVGMYLLARKHTSSWLAFLLGLAVFINPTMFYKYTAGHFNYMVSLTLFIYFLYFLFYKFGKNLRSAVVVGLFLGLLGFQIQFFVIAAIFVLVFFLFNRKLLSPVYLLVIGVIPILINLVWLANFISGAASAAEVGAQAAKVSFKSLSGSDFLSIFTFSFAKATLLTKFYAFYELLWNAAVFIFLLWLLVREKKKETTDVLLLVFLSIMIFMATGLYQALNLGPLTMLYPMLREVGHFAPVIVLIALVLIARLVQGRTWRWSLTIVLAGSLLIVGVKYQYFSQGYSFADARDKFAPFKQIADQDDSDYRILAYPFFDQYSFTDIPRDPPGVLPLKNSGHDSFAAFSQQEYINNAVAPHKFEDSLQYRLLQTYDISILRPYNVKYIFNFADFYESNYERYVPPSVYGNDISLIKNDKQFFDKLIANNPGQLRRVNDNVLEIRNVNPRIGGDTSMFALSHLSQADRAGLFTKEALDEPLDFVSDDKRIAPYTTKLTPLLSEPADMRSDYRNGTFSQTLRRHDKGAASLYVDRLHETMYYEARGNRVTVFGQSTGALTLNGQAIYDAGSQRRIMGEFTIPENTTYYISFKGKVIPVQEGKTERLGVGTQGDVVEILTSDGPNLVTNASFEQELWQDKVNDCNNYDFENNAKLGMAQSREASQGNASLELRAERHDACTYTNVALGAESDYLLTFDYQSPNARTASFFMGFEGDSSGFAKASQAIRNQQWGTYSSLVSTSDKAGTARLYLYALQQGDQETINRYDNVSLVKLAPVERITVPGLRERYEKIALPTDSEQEFTVSRTGQKFENLILNPSFEQGSWQKNVSDCRNYDNNGDIAMSLDTRDKTHGKQSLVLSATRHDACIRTTTNVTAGTEYQFAFDVKGKKGKSYAYAVSYDDPENTLRRQQVTLTKDNTWQRATVRVTAPARATTVTVYLYAIESGDKTASTIAYDNVSLIELPDFTDRFYVVEDPEKTLYAPARIDYEHESQTKKAITVRAAKTPFFLHLSETFHERWILELDNSQVRGMLASWKPGVTGTTVPDHFRVSNYMNGWLVDPAAVCDMNGKQRDGCTKNADGSYDIQLVAEFKPQRWFIIAAIISWATLIGCLAYVVASRGRELPTYQLLRTKQWRQALRRQK